MTVSRRSALAGLLAAGSVAPARAADWRPSRTMNWIVPYPPGGSNDTLPGRSRPMSANSSVRRLWSTIAAAPAAHWAA